ncbi:IclR family transcriptional regulator [Frankia sp. QA3]|uniref:IclR family transcriptional regulator n=1 Tax=Frankia sp. QA3 TaxID=710111 RepID=UPI0007C6D884|nr:helix-turn-helix domain-containing protein [Frankia sp. QA3]
MATRNGLAGPRPDSSGRTVLEGAFKLLEALSGVENAGLSQLARLADLPKATAHRLLTQLAALGIVEQKGVTYRIGSGLRRLASPVRPFRWLLIAGRKPCHALAVASGADVSLSVLRDGEALTVLTESVTRGLVFPEPTALPLATAAGQILLAELPDLGPPAGFSDHEWRRRRAAIRQHGIAFDRHEVINGMCCVAVPVRASDGRVVAALAARVSAGSLPRGLPDTVRRSAVAISRHLPEPPLPVQDRRCAH